jgi:type I restriction enzyme S subunit
VSSGRYQAYPEYKESGEYWLGRIPGTWNVARHKYVATFSKGKNPPTLLDSPVGGAVPYLSMAFLRGVDTPKYAMPQQAAYVAQKGQVLIIWDGSNAGEFIKGRDGILSSTMAAAEITNEIIPQYYWYVCACLEPEMRKHATGMGIPHVNGDELKSSSIPTPSLPEQTQIAAFLDHETGKIDRLIEKQQGLIALLKEKRQAVISHAVTQGLNPHAPLKDSGIEWLGQVPEHWDVKRIGTLFSESSQRAATLIELKYPILSVSIHHGISDSELSEDELDRKVTRSDDRSLYKIVQKNDLAYNMMRAWQGGFGASQIPGLISPAYVVCKPKTELNSEYFELVLRSPNAVTELKRFSRGITDFRLRLYWDEFKCIEVPVPPKEDIAEILSAIGKIGNRYDELVIVAKDQITLLQERRTALISAAVTGKIDVRAWQTPFVSELDPTEAATA